jgi:transposase InsO family protein
VRGWDPSIDRREDRQHDRIAQGIRSGELTRQEAQRLMAEQRMIRQEERLYKSDGVVTPWERRDLQRDLDVASQHIYNETHDADRRGFNTGFSR